MLNRDVNMIETNKQQDMVTDYPQHRLTDHLSFLYQTDITSFMKDISLSGQCNQWYREHHTMCQSCLCDNACKISLVFTARLGHHLMTAGLYVSLYNLNVLNGDVSSNMIQSINSINKNISFCVGHFISKIAFFVKEQFCYS